MPILVGSLWKTSLGCVGGAEYPNDKAVVLSRSDLAVGSSMTCKTLERGRTVAILSSQFSKALESIEPSADDKANAPKAHKAVRAALTSADELKAWTLNPVLIGSYKRDVSIRRVTDVDVFCRMEDIDDDVEGNTVLNKFFKVLDAEFGTDNDGNKRVKSPGAFHHGRLSRVRRPSRRCRPSPQALRRLLGDPRQRWRLADHQPREADRTEDGDE